MTAEKQTNCLLADWKPCETVESYEPAENFDFAYIFFFLGNTLGPVTLAIFNVGSHPVEIQWL